MDEGAYSWISLCLLILAICSLAWSLRWFWVVLRPREYEYPSNDRDIKNYAENIHNFHTETVISSFSAVDKATTRDLRLFVLDQHSSAAATNLRLNATKLKARPKVLLFMLIGFSLAFACEATIFLKTHFGARPAEQGASAHDAPFRAGSPTSTADRRRTASQTREAQAATDQRGRELLGCKHQTRHQAEAVGLGGYDHASRQKNGPASQNLNALIEERSQSMTKKPTTSSGNEAKPARPIAPPLQVMMKRSDVMLEYAQPSASEVKNVRSNVDTKGDRRGK